MTQIRDKRQDGAGKLLEGTRAAGFRMAGVGLGAIAME